MMKLVRISEIRTYMIWFGCTNEAHHHQLCLVVQKWLETMALDSQLLVILFFNSWRHSVFETKSNIVCWVLLLFLNKIAFGDVFCPKIYRPLFYGASCSEQPLKMNHIDSKTIPLFHFLFYFSFNWPLRFSSWERKYYSWIFAVML